MSFTKSGSIFVCYVMTPQWWLIRSVAEYIECLSSAKPLQGMDPVSKHDKYKRSRDVEKSRYLIMRAVHYRENVIMPHVCPDHPKFQVPSPSLSNIILTSNPVRRCKTILAKYIPNHPSKQTHRWCRMNLQENSHLNIYSVPLIVLCKCKCCTDFSLGLSVI